MLDACCWGAFLNVFKTIQCFSPKSGETWGLFLYVTRLTLQAGMNIVMPSPPQHAWLLTLQAEEQEQTLKARLL